jgi:thiol-disulfide isomerase/thioredoxin
MDRLPAVDARGRAAAAAILLAALLASSACSKDRDAPAPGPSRVEGAKVKRNTGATAAGFCDVHHAGDTGPVLVLPPLSGPPLAAPAPGHWRWVNVWATWCKPCVEEVPRLVRWQGKLAAAGHPVDLAFVSVDEEAGDIASFRARHPEMPDSPRLADSSKEQRPFFTALGLDTASSIPVHVLVTPSGRIRCVRAGGVSEGDYAAVQRVLEE